MKTNELTGKALNWAVRYALHGKPYSDYVGARDNFSTCWAKAGPIIEREEIELVPKGMHWDAYADEDFHVPYPGPTPLIAAMRCYVASKLGDTVDIPKELTQ